jgi:hypothetical protein
MSELLELRAVVEAGQDAVTDVLLDVRPGGRSPLAEDGEIDETDTGNEWVIVREGSRITVSVDRAARSVSMQGEWWYKGVTSVEPDPRGSEVIFRMFNVAEGNGWAVRFVSRGPLRAAPGRFAEEIRVLGERLGGVKTELLD